MKKPELILPNREVLGFFDPEFMGARQAAQFTTAIGAKPADFHDKFINGAEFFTAKLDQIIQYCRAGSIWPLTFGLACCAMEHIMVYNTISYSLIMYIIIVVF